MFSVAALWRYPIKSHGREPIPSVMLTEGKTMPWDRHWAVTHRNTKFDHSNPVWVMWQNFMIGVSTPGLAGISAQLDEATAQVTLRHKELGEITIFPDQQEDIAKFIDWVSPVCPADKRLPANIVKATDRGMTDTNFPSISIMTKESHKAVETALGHALEPERWRGNIWLDGPEAWSEFDWIGQKLRIGAARLAISAPIKRCNHTMANTETGIRDVDTLGALRDNWDHQNFGVYATVLEGGDISVGDKVELVP